MMVNLVADLAEEHALIQPQHVAGGEDPAESGEDGPREVGLRGALQNQEFADEIIQHGQADAGQRGDQEDGREPGRDRGDAAVIGDGKRMPAFIEEADQDEQGAGRDAVSQHLSRRRHRGPSG